MNKPNFLVALAAILMTFGAANVFSQSSADEVSSQSYDVVLQIVAGSSSGAATPLPRALENSASELKKYFPFTSYKPISSDFSRISDKGSISQKSFMNKLAETGGANVFARWTLTGLRKGDEPSRLAFSSFSFEAKIPVVSSMSAADNKSVPVINYEAIGLTLQTFSVLENTSTVIGTLPIPNSDESLIFVLNIKRSN